MPDLVDLHLHSTFSDGVLTPTELVAAAAEVGLKAIALADHDNIDGIDEALAAGGRLGVEVIPAVELSVVWGDYKDIHLLGYGFDHHDPALRGALAEFRAFRAGRSEQVLAQVNARLVREGRKPLDFAAVKQRAGGTLGRPHIGQALVAAGYVRCMEDAFVRYLVPCNVPKRYFPLDEAIDLVHAAGGCAVLAHPGLIGVPQEQMRPLLERFVALGLDGLEVYCPGADNHGIDWFLTQARQLGLVVTGGSDYHQPEPNGVQMGRGRGNLKIPYRCVEEIKARKALKDGTRDE